MSQEQYDLSDLLNFDLDFEFDDFGRIRFIHNISELIVAFNRFFEQQANSLTRYTD